MDIVKPSEDRAALEQAWNGLRAIQTSLGYTPLQPVPASYSNDRLARISRMAARRIQARRFEAVPNFESTDASTTWAAVYSLWFSLLGSGGSTALSTSLSTSYLGGNLDSTKDWNVVNPFKNLMITARPWEVPGQAWEQENNLVRDANGWIINFSGNIAASTYFFADNSIAGSYVILWDGDGSFAGGTIEAITGFTFANETPGRAVLTVSSNNSNVGMRIKPVANMLNYTRNIRIVKAADESSFVASPFNADYLAMLAPFSFLRLMDFHATNWSSLQNWSDRPTKASFAQVGESANGLHPKGVAYEYGIELCNTAKKHLWICVPHKATDAFVTSLATLIKDSLNANLKIHVEYSNEVWNGQFSQFNYSGTTGLTQGLASTQYDAGFKFYGKRSREIWRIFRMVFGAANHSRLIRVFAGQGANPYVSEQGLQWQADNGGIEADVLAIAPYFDGESPVPGGGATIAGILAGNYASWNSTMSVWTNLGATNPGGSISRTWNSQPPSNPSNGQKWHNNSNIMPIIRPPDWAGTPTLKQIWQNAVLALSIDQIIAALAHDVANYRPAQINSNKNMLLGKGWNIPIVAYEGGGHLVANGFLDDAAVATMTTRFNAVNNDDRIKPIITSYLNSWKTLSGSNKFCWFSVSSTWNKYGFWGLYKGIGSSGKSVKADAVEAWVAANPGT